MHWSHVFLAFTHRCEHWNRKAFIWTTLWAVQELKAVMHYCIHRLHSCHCDSSFMALDLYFKWMLNYNSSKMQQAYKTFHSSTQWFFMGQGTDSIKRCHLTSIGNPIVEIRRSNEHLISTMGCPILVRRHLYIEWRPRLPWDKSCLSMTISWHLPTTRDVVWPVVHYDMHCHSWLNCFADVKADELLNKCFFFGYHIIGNTTDLIQWKELRDDMYLTDIYP